MGQNFIIACLNNRNLCSGWLALDETHNFGVRDEGELLGVLFPSDKKFHTTESTVQAALAELHIPDGIPVGVKLNPLQKYIQSFQSAEDAAEQGLPELTWLHLQQAERYAGEAGVNFDEARAEQMMHKSYVNGVEISFKSAEYEARNKDHAYFGPDIVERRLQAAATYAQEVGIDFNETRAAHIRQTSYVISTESTLKLAEGSAQSLGDTEVILESAREFAQKAGIKFDETKAARIMRAHDKNAMENQFRAAERSSELREFFLQNTAKYAQAAGIKFDQKRADRIRSGR